MYNIFKMNIKNKIFSKQLSNVFKSVLTLMLFVIGSFQAKATHIVGGEITYRCLGNNKYEIILTVYRDCYYGDPKVGFDDPAWLGFYSTATKLPIVALGPQGVVNVPYDATDTLDQQLTSECNIIGQDICVHRAVYRKVVTLPKLAGGYTVVYQRCCRNETLQNIEVPLNTGAVFSIEISDKALDECNSSPRYEDWPPIYICANKALNYDHSAIDDDGDQIIYRLCNPYMSGDTAEGRVFPPPPPPFDTVIWAPGYNLQNLLGGPDPLRIDLNTGIIQGTPTVIGQFLVGVCVEEFRDGILLSRIRRDFQYNVRDCSNPTAACFNLPDTLCNTTTVTFENCSQSTTEYKWTFYDGSGSIMSTSTDFEPTVSYPAYGTYKVQLIASEGPACIDTMIKDITISPTNIVADFSLSVPDCGNSITIKTTNLSTNGTNFSWTLTKGGNVINTSTLVAPQFTVNEEGDYTITLIAFHVNGCSDTIQKSITTHLLGDEILENYHELCKGESVELNPNGNTSYQYTWSPATYLSPGPDVPNPVSTPDNDITYLVDILDPESGCILKDTVTVAIKEDPKLNFTYTNECGSLTVIFANLTTPAQNSYSWDFGDGVGTSTDVNPTYTYSQSGSYWVKIQNTSGCEKIDSQLVKVNYIDIDAVNDSIYLCGTDTVSLNPNGNPNYKYVWQPADKIIGSNTVPNPQAVIDQYTVFTVLVSDPTFSDCNVTGRVAVDLANLTMVTDSKFVCEDEQTTISTKIVGGAPSSIVWAPDDNRLISGQGTATITVVGKSNEVYTVTATFASGCVISGSTNLTVGTYGGTVSASIALDTIYNSETVQLFAEPSGLSYVWTPAEGLNNPNAQNPIYTPGPEGNKVFTVTVTTKDNCSKSASVNLYVRQTLCDGNHVFLPTAFSPNGKGDARNEVLQLFNDGIVDKINKFVVYNRFGQEVFSSTDLNFKWDGKFNGKELDPDVYGYYLDVECIDGQKFKSKGNITLIK